jgi:uncharacterized protein (TIGR00251 family)
VPQQQGKPIQKSPPVIEDSPAGVTIEIRVIPRARKTEFAGSRQGALLIRLAAPPVDGAANHALVAFLANRLRVPVQAVRILAGERSRQKRILVTGRRADDVRARLGLD